MISASYEVSYVAYVALLASIFVMATVEIVGTACGMSSDEIRTLAFEFVKQIGIFAFLVALTILAVYSPILAALSLSIGLYFVTVCGFEVGVNLSEGHYVKAFLLSILLVFGMKGAIAEGQAFNAGATGISSGGRIAEKAKYQSGLKSPKANEARAILQRFVVDINDAANGVFLPTQRGVSNSAYHPSLHTDSYCRKVTEYLRSATSREDLLDILDNIAEELLDGSF